MANDKWIKRTVDSYASFLARTADVADARQFLLDFFTLVTSESHSNDFVNSIFCTSSVTREEYAYRIREFTRNLKNELDLKN